MRTYLPWLLILLAVGLGYWLFATDPSDREPAFDVGGEFEGPDASTPRGTGLRGAAKGDRGGSRPKTPKKVWHPADPRTLPKGDLLLQPLGPDLEPIIDRGLRLVLKPRGQRVSRLGRFVEETGATRFKDVIAGEVTVRISGDHIVGRTVTTTVTRDEETPFEVHLERAGAVRYTVTTYAKTRPAKVRVELFDAAGRPAEGWFQVRSTRSLTQPRKVRALDMGPEGIIFGLRPGAYRVKVTHIETDEWDDGEVVIAAGKTETLNLEVRR